MIPQSKLLVLLGYVRRRPLMYLSKKTIDNLVSFIVGYRACEISCGGHSDPLSKLILGSDFKDFANDRLGSIGQPGQNKLPISEVSDDEKFDRYFDIFHEFIQSKFESDIYEWSPELRSSLEGSSANQ